MISDSSVNELAVFFSRMCVEIVLNTKINIYTRYGNNHTEPYYCYGFDNWIVSFVAWISMKFQTFLHSSWNPTLQQHQRQQQQQQHQLDMTRMCIRHMRDVSTMNRPRESVRIRKRQWRELPLDFLAIFALVRSNNDMEVDMISNKTDFKFERRRREEGRGKQ